MYRFNHFTMALLGSAFLAFSLTASANTQSEEDELRMYQENVSDPVYGNSTFGFGSQMQGGVDDEYDKLERLVRAKNYEQKGLLKMDKNLSDFEFSQIARQQEQIKRYVEQEKAAGRYDEKTKKKVKQMMKDSYARTKKWKQSNEKAVQAIKEYQKNEGKHIEEYRKQIRENLDNKIHPFTSADEAKKVKPKNNTFFEYGE